MRRYGWDGGTAALYKMVRAVAEAHAEDMTEITGVYQDVDTIETNMHRVIREANDQRAATQT